MMVPKPFPLIVQCDEKQVLTFELINDIPGIHRPRHSVAQRRGEPAQYCRPHKKLLNRFRLTADYLFGQEIHHIAITVGNVTGKLAGAGWSRRDSAARYKPAGQPSDRSTSSDRSWSISLTAATCWMSASACLAVARGRVYTGQAWSQYCPVRAPARGASPSPYG